MIASATAAGVVANGAGSSPSVIFVCTKPGRTIMTWTPLPSRLSPRPWKNASSPALDEPYTKFDRREKIAAEGLERLTTEYGAYFIPQVIRTTTDFSQGLARRETIFASLKKSHAKEDYDYYVRHILGLDRFADGR